MASFCAIRSNRPAIDANAMNSKLKSRPNSFKTYLIQTPTGQLAVFLLPLISVFR